MDQDPSVNTEDDCMNNGLYSGIVVKKRASAMPVDVPLKYEIKK